MSLKKGRMENLSFKIRILLSIIFIGIILVFFNSCESYEDVYSYHGTETWTVMVYLDGDNNLEPNAINDFNEMERGIYNSINFGNRDMMLNLNVIVLMDLSLDQDTKLYRVNADNNLNSINSERLDDGGSEQGHISQLDEKNMGDPDTLSWFIDYSKTNFPSENYALILWNHGDGVRSIGKTGSSYKGICIDETDGDDELFLDELQQAVSENFTSQDKLDIIGFDACLMGMVEIAYEFKDLADYMVASMQQEQLDGWDYEYIFGKMIKSRDESLIIPEEMAKFFVEAYKHFIDQFNWDSGETMSAVKLSEIDSLKSAVDSLAVALYNKENSSHPISSGTQIEVLRDNSIHFYNSNVESILWPNYDLNDLCNNLINASISSEITSAANNVKNILGNVVLYAYGDDDENTEYYYGPGSDVKRGLSIFFSRGNIKSGDDSQYAYQYWYTSYDIYGNGLGNYGNIDFCQYDNDANVETWVELMEAWYDPVNSYTVSTF